MNITTCLVLIALTGLLVSHAFLIALMLTRRIDPPRRIYSCPVSKELPAAPEEFYTSKRTATSHRWPE